MINQLFYSKNKKVKPIVLTDCSLIVGLKLYEMNKAYVFMKQITREVSQVGDIWVKYRKKSDLYYKGYFSVHNAYNLSNIIHDNIDIQIIGYTDKKQYHLFGVSIGGNSRHSLFTGDIAAEFWGNDFNIKTI